MRPSSLATLHLYRRLDRGAGGLRARLRRVVSGVLVEALSEAEQVRLTAGLYDRPGPKRTALFGWEKPWFAALPPGRVLVGGAGDGREVAALRALGHGVDALEPAPGLAQKIEGAGVAVTADYAALSALFERAGPCDALRDRRYAAIVLGWGSLTHVLTAQARLRLIQACHRLCPDGPILASFWLQGSAHDAGDSHLAHAVGRLVGRARGLPAAPDRQFAPWCGFGARLSRAEVEALGHAVGRETRWGEGLYPHVTWV
jgi:hypothetical protein